MSIKNITQKLRTLLVLPMISLPMLCLGQDKKEINTENFTIDINYMIPRRYSAKAVTDFTLSIKGDSVISCLPYMGQGYYPAIGNSDGLNFSLPITEKRVKKGKKGKTVIQFSCRKNSVSYEFKVETYPEGSAYVYLHPSNADAISYKGDWE